MSSPDPAALDRAQDILKQLWQRHKGTIFERLVVLEDASEKALTLDESGLAEARSAAHKLAGSLGTFGFHAGSDWARDSENIFIAAKITEGERTRLTENAANIRKLLESAE